MWFGEEKQHYCPPGKDVDKLIHRTHIANYINDTTIMILGCSRIIYFVYVLICVCRNNATKPFFKRPAFMNWLPILILISSAG